MADEDTSAPLPSPMPARAALVTGGTSGIGRALALGLAEDGYAVTTSGRDSSRAEAVEKQARDAGWELTAVVADAADEQEIIDLVADHERRYGRLDVLISNAGQGTSGSAVETMTTELIDSQIGINLRGPLLLSREAIPLLRMAGAEHGKALLINIASIAGRERPPRGSIYAATKFALETLTGSIRKELAGAGVQVTVFVPAATASGAMVDPFRSMGVADDDMIQLADLVAAVRFLLALSPSCMIPDIQFDSPLASPIIHAAFAERNARAMSGRV